MEERFGHDFQRVRIHADPQAAQSSEALRANAYSIGADIVFAAGRYVPDTAEGQRLIAHELAHIVQADATRAPALTDTESLTVGDPADPLEREADSVADQVLRAERQSIALGTQHASTARATLRRDGDREPPIIIDIPPAPRRPASPLQVPPVYECRMQISALKCSELVALPGSKVATTTVGGDEIESEVTSCDDAICGSPGLPTDWISVPENSGFDCGDDVTICANGYSVEATVINQRKERNQFHIPPELAVQIGGAPGVPFIGTVFGAGSSKDEWTCCSDTPQREPGDFEQPDSDERMA